MNEYWLYFFFTLTNIPLYFILFQLIRDRQILQGELLTLYEQLMQERHERRYSDMEEGNSDGSSCEQEENDMDNDDNEIVKQKNSEENHEKLE
jgi:hypothetical protein